MSRPKVKGRSILPQARVVSIIGLLVTLITLGAIALLQLIGSGISHNIQERLTFTVELSDDHKDAGAELLSSVRSIRGVKSADLIDADSAVRLVTREINEDPVAVLGYNPFMPMLQLSLQPDYLSTDSLLLIEERLRGIGVEASLSYEEEVMTSMQRNIKSIQTFLWAVLILQLVLSALQINSSTKLLIHSERFKIRTLTLVGATAWFIRRPILVRSIVDGLVSALLALAFLGVGIFVTEYSLDIEVWSLLDTRGLVLAVMMLVTVAVIVCAVSSWRASLRYIRMDGSKIHLV